MERVTRLDMNTQHHDARRKRRAYPNRYRTMARARDAVATDGMKVTLGGATVILSNHSAFDGAVDRNKMLAGRGNGPHPYEVGARQ